MRLILLQIVCALFTNVSIAHGQEYNSEYPGKNMLIQKLVHDALGKTVTLNFKTGEHKAGTLLRANGTEFILGIDGSEEIFQTETVHSITVNAGISEGILVLLSGGLNAGFGMSAAALSFDGLSSTALIAVAVIFGVFGGWLGYESFFQEVEIVLP